MSPAPSALVLFAHGAREPAWARPFERLQQMLQAGPPPCIVELAFLECMTPTLEEVADRLAAQGIRHILVVPVFMSAGRHLRRDLPHLLDRLRQRHPGIDFQATPPVGEMETVLAAMAAGIRQATGD